MPDKSSIFEQHAHAYFDQLARMDFSPFSYRLGVTVEDRSVTVPVFGQPYRISPDRICRPDGSPADYTTTVIVCRYLLQCPSFDPGEDRWQTFKDFPDAAPLVSYFTVNVEQAVAGHFAGRLSRLRHAAERIGGQRPAMELSVDFLFIVSALPRIPLLVLFNEADEDFPAQSSVLFEHRARHYLDMECLAMVGTLLVNRLIRSV